MKKCYFIVIKKNQLMAWGSIVIMLGIFITLLFSNLLTSETAYNPTLLTDFTTQKPSKLAIIIDDFGSDRNGVKEMMEIDRHLTFAVMPFMPYSQTDATEGFEKGFEIIVHLPMEPVKGKISWLGPKPILSTLSDSEVIQITSDAFLSVPNALGANIHMGSKISADTRIMSCVLDVVKQNGAYFLDSKTSAQSVAKELSLQKNITYYERNIFLDGQTSKEHIKEQLRKACDFALKNGKAVAIGHVGIEGGKVTAQAIQEMLPEFDQKNIQLVFASEL